MSIAQGVAKIAFGHYELYRIYACSPTRNSPQHPTGCQLARIYDPQDLLSSDDPEMKQLAKYDGAEAYGFFAKVDSRIAAGCYFWTGDLYRRERNFWPLGAKEAKLVQITTGVAFRGRGIAPLLLRFAASEMASLGYERLFARIWHSNRPSLSAFEKAGWEYIAFVVRIFPLGLGSGFRMVWANRSNSRPLRLRR